MAGEGRCRSATPGLGRFPGVPELVLPTAQLHAEFLACRDDWGPGLHEDGFGIGADDDLESPDSFGDWVHDRLRLTHPPRSPCPTEQRGSPSGSLRTDKS